MTCLQTTLALGLLALAAGARPNVTDELPPAERPPNVLILIADDISDAELDLIHTPNIDALASNGTRFRRAYSAPICSPTRFAMMFGAWQGVGGGGGACKTPGILPYPDTTRTSLPKLMAGNGYQTALFGKWHLSSNPMGAWELTPQLHGFETWRAGLPSNVRLCGGGGYSKWMRADDGVSGITTEYHTIAVRDAFLDWWAQPGAGQRFGWVGFQAPHTPHHFPPSEILPGGCGSPVGATTRQKYECMVRSLDFVIGEMLAFVSLSDTIVVFLGDNGTTKNAVAPGLDPGKSKTTTFEGGVRVPLIVAGPGVRQGVETDALAHAVDLLATLAEAIDSPPRVAPKDSVSVWPVLTGAKRSVRTHVYCGDTDTSGDRAIVTNRWKLRDVDGVQTIYDLYLDPSEDAPIDPATLPELAAWLQRLLSEV